MDKPRMRFTVMSALLALLVGVLHLRPLGVIRVDARGLGHEQIDPTRHRSN